MGHLSIITVLFFIFFGGIFLLRLVLIIQGVVEPSKKVKQGSDKSIEVTDSGES